MGFLVWGKATPHTRAVGFFERIIIGGLSVSVLAAGLIMLTGGVPIIAFDAPTFVGCFHFVPGLGQAGCNLNKRRSFQI